MHMAAAPAQRRRRRCGAGRRRAAVEGRQRRGASQPWLAPRHSSDRYLDVCGSRGAGVGLAGRVPRGLRLGGWSAKLPKWSTNTSRASVDALNACSHRQVDRQVSRRWRRLLARPCLQSATGHHAQQCTRTVHLPTPAAVVQGRLKTRRYSECISGRAGAGAVGTPQRRCSCCSCWLAGLFLSIVGSSNTGACHNQNIMSALRGSGGGPAASGVSLRLPAGVASTGVAPSPAARLGSVLSAPAMMQFLQRSGDRGKQLVSRAGWRPGGPGPGGAA